MDRLFNEIQRPERSRDPPSENFSYNNSIDIEALNADIYDSTEEYPFQNGIASEKDGKCCSSDNGMRFI